MASITTNQLIPSVLIFYTLYMGLVLC